MSHDQIRAAIKDCLARCFAGVTPLGIIAEFSHELRDAGWDEIEIRHVEIAVRRVLAGTMTSLSLCARSRSSMSHTPHIDKLLANADAVALVSPISIQSSISSWQCCGGRKPTRNSQRRLSGFILIKQRSRRERNLKPRKHWHVLTGLRLGREDRLDLR